jgi:hypothetical protein
MANEHLVTQGELADTIRGLDALANNLNEHVNQSLSKSHGLSLLSTAYLDSGGIYHTDFGQTGYQPIPGLHNTGVNDDGTLATLGTVDTHWTLILSPDPVTPGPSTFVSNPIKSNWSSNGPKSQWISPAINASVSRKSGSYKFRITFNLSGFNPASAIISGSWVSDNKTTAVLLNGIVTGYTSPANFSKQPGAGAVFTLNSGFVPGVNTLDFIVNNDGGPVGIRVEVSGIATAGGVFAIPGLYATGVNDSNTVLPQGSVDPHWTLIQSADSNFPGPQAYVYKLQGSYGYAPNSATSVWISPRPQGDSAAGLYRYRLTFDLTGFNPNATILKGRFWSNDRTLNVYVNGIATGITNPENGKRYPTSFVITSGFLDGLNTIDFEVTTNHEDTGFRCEISGTASTTGSGLEAHVLRINIGGNVFYVPTQASGGLDGEPDPVIPVFTGIISPQSADPASDLTVGSPTPAKLITTFAEALNVISDAASTALSGHAGDSAENVHGGLSWQQDAIYTTTAYLVGRRSINIILDGVPYKIVADTNVNGPINL